MSDINVASSTSTYTGYQSGAVASSDSKAKAEDAKSAETKPAENSGVVYEKGSEPAKKAPYTINKMSAEERAQLVEKLKQDDANRRSQLTDLVSQMLSKQGHVAKLADLFKPENLTNVKMEDILQAKKDIAEDGYYGVKETSQRLFDFASALAGDDVEKMKEMQAAMEKGFKKATKAWGEDLPDICKDTINAANKLFEDYYASKKTIEE